MSYACTRGTQLFQRVARQRQVRVGAGGSVAFFTDNLQLLSALCNGSSSVVNFGMVVHAMLLQVAAYRLLAWCEHVDSAANIADGGSRRGPAGTLLARDFMLGHCPALAC